MLKKNCFYSSYSLLFTQNCIGLEFNSIFIEFLIRNHKKNVKRIHHFKKISV